MNLPLITLAFSIARKLCKALTVLVMLFPHPTTVTNSITYLPLMGAEALKTWVLGRGHSKLGVDLHSMKIPLAESDNGWPVVIMSDQKWLKVGTSDYRWQWVTMSDENFESDHLWPRMITCGHRWCEAWVRSIVTRLHSKSLRITSDMRW